LSATRAIQVFEVIDDPRVTSFNVSMALQPVKTRVLAGWWFLDHASGRPLAGTRYRPVPA